MVEQNRRPDRGAISTPSVTRALAASPQTFIGRVFVRKRVAHISVQMPRLAHAGKDYRINLREMAGLTKGAKGADNIGRAGFGQIALFE